MVLNLKGIRPDGSQYDIGLPSETIISVTATSAPNCDYTPSLVVTEKYPGGYLVANTVESITAAMNRRPAPTMADICTDIDEYAKAPKDPGYAICIPINSLEALRRIIIMDEAQCRLDGKKLSGYEYSVAHCQANLDRVRRLLKATRPFKSAVEDVELDRITEAYEKQDA